MGWQNQLLIGFSMAVFAGTVGAAPIVVDPVSATDNGHYTDAGTGTSATATMTINGSGLSDGGASVATGSPIPASYPTVTPDPSFNSFFSNYAVQPGTTPVVTYNLGSAYTITGGHFWQYSGDTTPDTPGLGARSLVSADIYTSTTGLPGSYTLAGTLTPGYVEGPYPPTAAATPDPGVNFSLLAPVTNVQFIQLQNIVGVPNQYITVAFNEIRFTAAPEPASLGLLGLGGLGLLARRRRA